jgi:hypothetical protein
MARKKAGTAVANWEEELAAQAETAAGMEASVAAGQFFGLKNGILTFNDAPLPGNQMVCIIIDHILENVFYADAYDSDNPAGPVCFAFGRDDKTLEPHEDSIDKQSSACVDCPQNEWASADTGRGKACRNTRRLGIVAAGSVDRDGNIEMFDDPEHYESTAVGFMKLPVTSVKGYAAFVKNVASVLKRPPHGVFTHVKVVDDDKNQFRVLFEPLGQVPNELMSIIMQRHQTTADVIDFPYQVQEESDKPKPKRKAKAKAKRGAKGTRRSTKY